jgi:hypothetical protein
MGLPGFPRRAPGSRASHLGNIQTALLGRFTPATTGLATVPRANFRAFNVVEVLDRLVAEHGKPKTIRVDKCTVDLPRTGPSRAIRLTHGIEFENAALAALD